MRIGIISRSWFTEIKGGAERYVYETTKELIRRGYEVTTISRHKSDLPNRHIAIRSPGVPFITSAMTSFLSGILADLGEYDIIIANGFWAEFSPLLLTKPWIVVIHDIGLFGSQWSKEHRLKHLFRRIILSRVVKKAMKIIVPSKLTFNEMKSYLGVGEEKLELIAEGIDLEKFKPFPHVSDGILRIFQFGRFAPNKGQEVLIRAFKKVHEHYPNMKLYLVGYLSRDALPYYTHLLSISEGERDILLETDVSDEELIEYYNQADLCVFPSLGEEGWGITVTEAFACRVPVICSPIFFQTGVADETRALFSLPDPEQLAEKVLWAIEHQDVMENLASKGYEFVQDLSWEKTVDKIVRVIETKEGEDYGGRS